MKPQTSGASVANRMPVSAPASPKLAAKDLVLVGVLGAVAGAVCMGVQYSCQQTFVALGQARISLFLALLRKVILLIPLIYLLPRFLSDQVFAVLLAEPVADVCASVTTGIVFFMQFPRILSRRAQALAGSVPSSVPEAR